MKNKFHFAHLPNNTLLELLKEPEFASSLAYLVDYKNHENLKIIPKEHSIELSNNDITISIILYSGFEKEEYNELKNCTNVNLVCFSNVIPEMCEFEGMNIKFIDKLAWLFSILGRSERDFVCKLNRLKTLRID